MAQQKEDLQRRHKESADRSSQGQFGTIFLRDKVPEGVTFWNCKSDKHVIDIIPYFAGKDDPNAEEGKAQYLLDIWVHRNVGARDLVYVCPAYTWGEACPVCEDLKEQDYDEDYYDKMKAKHRTIYLVWVHDSPKEEKEGIKIWDVAHFFMQNHLDELAESPRSGGIVIFSDPDEGKMIGFSRKGTGAMNTKFIAHQFIERDEPIPDDILESAFPLDSVVKMRPSYEEIEKAYRGTKSEPAEQQQEEQAAEEEEPRKRRVPLRREQSTDDNECPAGGRFGVDIDKLADCEKCAVWDDCAAEFNKEAEPEQEQPEEKRRLPRRRATE